MKNDYIVCRCDECGRTERFHETFIDHGIIDAYCVDCYAETRFHALYTLANNAICMCRWDDRRKRWLKFRCLKHQKKT